MVDIQTIEKERLNRGMLLLRAEFAKRNWSVRVPYKGSSICYIDRGDGKQLRIYSTTPPTTSYVAAYIADDKMATNVFLDSIGVRQLKSVSVSSMYGINDAWRLLDKVGCAVVKPFDGGHGRGITVGVKTVAQLKDAITYAMTFTKSAKKVVVQEQFAHAQTYDIRIACINGIYKGAIWRVPARVYGDGVHTVKELVTIENGSPQRGVPYYAPLAQIDEERAAKFLGDAYDSVPQDGQEVTVLGVANYGAGGELVDITDDIPDWMINEAEKISVELGLFVSGVDYMAASVPARNATREDLDAVVIEVNKCPSLAIHDAPTKGTPRGAVAAYVDYLATITVD